MQLTPQQVLEANLAKAESNQHPPNCNCVKCRPDLQTKPFVDYRAFLISLSGDIEAAQNHRCDCTNCKRCRAWVQKIAEVLK